MILGTERMQSRSEARHTQETATFRRQTELSVLTTDSSRGDVSLMQFA